VITLDHGWLGWDERDALVMAKIFGAEQAVKLRCPYNPAVLKLAKRHDLLLDEPATRRLRDEVTLRERLKPAKRLNNAPGEADFFPWQRADVNYMMHARFASYLLGHQAGVGKTLEAITLVRAHNAKRVLTICPNSAKDQWREELIRWVPKSEPFIRVLDGTKAEQIQTASLTGRWWIIAHWEALVHARLGLLARPWDAVIADEAHRAQNRNAQRTETLHDLEARIRLALTAHPFTSSPEELFPILKFLYPERYTSFWRYTMMHVEVEPKPFGGFEFGGARRPNLLKWEIAPFTLRRTKVSLGWRPPTRIRRAAELTDAGRREYDKLKKQFFAALEGYDGAERVLAIPSALARVTRLRQYLVDPGLLRAREPSVKYPVVAEILGELDGPPVIFTAFEQAARRLQAYLDRKNVGLIVGTVSRKEQTKAKKDFLAGRLDALIVTMGAGGESLNLGRYGYVILLDLPWHPRGLEQCEGRVDRPEEGTGKVVATTSFRIVVPDSYEPKMEARIEARHGQFKEVWTVAEHKELFA
jgi:SNF2 family DNA or RNA helicase